MEPDSGMKKIPNKNRTLKSDGDLQNLYDTDDVMSDDAKSCLSINDNGQSYADFDDAFGFPNRRSAPVELEKYTVNCIALENVLYENEPSDKLSKIKKSDILFNTESTSPSTGNAPNNSIVNNHCYMAEEVHVKITTISQSRNLTPVTIMVADTIGTIKSRRLLKVLLDSGSTTTLINKRCLPRKCQPCKTSQSRMVNTLAGTYLSVIYNGSHA